ncbi:MAG: Hpt domain-containing protein [Candidatus Wallbacteria bacterium]|nr:Hpt domain-containing protein [Candidatus Wallbacteria bacterium]
MTLKPIELKARIADFSSLLKGGPLATRAFVEAFGNAVDAEDSEQSYFPEFLEDFKSETGSILDKIRVTVNALASGAAVDQPQLAEAFRFCHMMKGSAATMGFNRLSYLAHGLERAFEELKEKRLSPTNDLVQVLQEGFALVEELLRSMA